MPGIYLLVILASAGGIAALDARWRLAAWSSPGRTALAVLISTAFFLVWDAVGIASGVFVKGDSPLLIGVDIAPQLPIEEPFFLAFLCYLGLVAWAAALRIPRLSVQGTPRRGDPARRALDTRPEQGGSA